MKITQELSNEASLISMSLLAIIAVLLIVIIYKL
jgi:hypothetical protein